MRSARSLLKSWWRKLRPVRQPDLRVRPAVVPAEKKPFSSLEPLEGRIAPAVLLNPATLIYKDLDGDIVTVKFSKPLFSQAGGTLDVARADVVFKFNTGNVSSGPFDPASAPAQQLQLMDLTKVNASLSNSAVNGAAAKITSAPGSLTVNGVSTPGDGFVDIGYLKANGLSLGLVTVDGDLGQIDAGKSNAAIGLAGLKVKSMGVRGLATQAAGGSLESNILGRLGSLTVTDDIQEASIRVVNGSNFNTSSLGRIGSITIGGSLIGRDAVETASDNTGLIESANDIGVVKIGTNLSDGIFGGGGKNSGSIRALGKITSVTVAGNLSADQGAGSGSVQASGAIGATVVKGSILGGSGVGSGTIQASALAGVTIGNDLVAGTATNTGTVTSLGAIGAVKIGGDIAGNTVGAGTSSGGILATGKITSVNLTGMLIGGGGIQTGFIQSDADLGALILHGIQGGTAQNAGSIFAGGKIASLLVTQNVTGGSASGAGSVFSGSDALLPGDIGAVKIGGQLVGGAGTSSGVISSGGKIASLTIGPSAAVDQISLQGGAGDFSGSVFSLGSIGAVKIAGHLEGGDGDFSGSLVSRDRITPEAEVAGDLGTVVIKGHILGGAGNDSGAILADGKLAGVKVGAVTGFSGDRSGSIRAGLGSVNSGTTGAISIAGALTGGTGELAGGIVTEGSLKSLNVTGNTVGTTIRAGDDLGSLTVGGNVDETIVSARGKAVQTATSDLAIGKITIRGDVSGSLFLAGYDTALLGQNPDAQIGAVAVIGSWEGSSIAAGVNAGLPGEFGTSADAAISGIDNAKIVSSIASIVIGGNLTESAGAEHFGFVAQKVGAFKAAGVAQPLNGLADSQVFELIPDEITIREVAVANVG